MHQIDRTIWKTPFQKQAIPPWQCPKCHAGFLGIQGTHLTKWETQESKEAVGEEHWEPEWTKYQYIAVFECSNKSCQQMFSSCGLGAVMHEMKFDEKTQELYDDLDDYFTPQFFHPPLEMFQIPKKCPVSVADAIRASFATFFCDQAASLNHTRQAVELLLSEQKIPKNRIVNGKKKYIVLHARIELFQRKYSKVTSGLIKRLYAIKWLGNVGSHSGTPTLDDVLDSYDILSHVLDSLYDKSDTKLNKLVNSINRRRGPAARK